MPLSLWNLAWMPRADQAESILIQFVALYLEEVESRLKRLEGRLEKGGE